MLGAGQVLEDIEMYNKVNEMFNIFSAEDTRIKAYADAFGNYWERVCSE